MNKVYKKIILFVVIVLIGIVVNVNSVQAMSIQEVLIHGKGAYTAGTRSVYGPSLTQRELDEVASKVTEFMTLYIREDMTESEKVKTAHDYLVKNCSYAPDWSKNRANTAWGALIYHQAQCSGYARAFKALCDAMEIGCYYVHADENAFNPSHQWNIVRVDGVWSHIDVQANDSSGFNFIYLSEWAPMTYDESQFPRIGVKETYVGNINSELQKITVAKNQKGASYVSGQMVVVEWVNGKSTVPEVKPKMKLKSTDGKVSLDVFVTPTGTNTYYFDRFIEGIDTTKQYYFELTSGDSRNISNNKAMKLYFTKANTQSKTIGKYGNKKIIGKGQTISFAADTYVGNINSELQKIAVAKNQKGASYVSGQMVVVEWVNGKSTVPEVKPKMKLKSTDGKVSLDVFVTPTGTNTYYFDRFIEGIDTTKQYYFELTSGDSRNISNNKAMKLYFTKTNTQSKTIGKYGNKKIIGKGQTISFAADTYVGNINSELQKIAVAKNQKGASYVSGQVVVVEWVNGKSTVPEVKPKMKLKSTDGKVSLDVFVIPTGTNTYYFDRFIEGIDTTKQYYFELSSGDSRNVSTNKLMKAALGNRKIGNYQKKTIQTEGTKIFFK